MADERPDRLSVPTWLKVCVIATLVINVITLLYVVQVQQFVAAIEQGFASAHLGG